MVISKDEFKRLNPLWHIVVDVGYLYKDDRGIFKLPDNVDTRQLNANHKGIVVKEPVHKEVRFSLDGGIKHGAEYEIILGDTVYFGWNALHKIDKLDETDVLIVEDGDSASIYLMLDYRDLILCKRGEVMFGLNGYCAGYHPKKEKSGLHSDIIYLPLDNWEQEVINAVNGTIYEHDKTDVVLDELEVLYAPLSEVYWDLDDVVNTTKVRVGDRICFPEGMAIPLTNELKSEYNLMAVNVREVFAYSS